VSKEMLSDDELNALLREESERDDPLRQLSAMEKDALGEVGNISFGSAATALSTILGHKVTITTPAVTLLPGEQLASDFPIPHVAAQVEYTKGLEGANILAIRSDDARVIADLMLGGDGRHPETTLNELHLSAVGEAMNQMMGSAATALATFVHMDVNISPPTVVVIDSDRSPRDLLIPSSDIVVKVSFRLQVGELIDSHIMQVSTLAFARKLLQMVMPEKRPSSSTLRPAEESVAETPPGRGQEVRIVSEQEELRGAPEPQFAHAAGADVAGAHDGGREDSPSGRAAAQYRAMGAESLRAGPAEGGLTAATASASAPSVARAAFAPLNENERPQAGRNLDLLMDIPLGVTVELGRTRKLIREVLELARGSILELDTLAGEPVDILVNQKLIARGEVVVIDENFGVRVTDIISPSERIRRLQ
jgi:flagellar motor switch protein FliN/FliY